jgi:cobalamin biosynthesis Mg chelatase CobN
MKHQILLKSFLLLMFILASSSLVYASEVTGPLSSDKITNTQNTNGGGTGSSTVTSSSGGGEIISGTVNGGSSSLSSTVTGSTSSTSGGETIGTIGTVLGASTLATNSPATDLISPDGMALGASSNNLALGNGVNAIPSTAQTITPTEVSNQAATVLGALGNFSFSNWFWIIFLLLLLVVTIIYIYRPRKKKSVVQV